MEWQCCGGEDQRAALATASENPLRFAARSQIDAVSTAIHKGNAAPVYVGQAPLLID
jgi:hypothetical protein